MTIDFTKVQQHLEHTLDLKLDGQSVIIIKPKIGSKAKFMKIIKTLSNKEDTLPLKNFLFDIITETEHIENNKVDLLKHFIADNIDTFMDQLIIGFRISTKKEMDEAVKVYKDNKLGKK